MPEAICLLDLAWSPTVPFLPCHRSLKVYQGGAAEPSGAPGPHQHTYSLQEDHQAEPAAEAGGGASIPGEHGGVPVAGEPQE